MGIFFDDPFYFQNRNFGQMGDMCVQLGVKRLKSYSKCSNNTASYIITYYSQTLSLTNLFRVQKLVLFDVRAYLETVGLEQWNPFEMNTRTQIFLYRILIFGYTSTVIIY